MSGMYLFFTTLASHLADTGATVSNCPDAPNDVCATPLPRVNADNASLQTILQYAFGVIAALAALMIVIAGLRLVVNAGDTDAVAKLRRTIIYAAVGLVIAIFADVLVGWVLNNI